MIYTIIGLCIGVPMIGIGAYLSYGSAVSGRYEKVSGLKRSLLLISSLFLIASGVLFATSGADLDKRQNACDKVNGTWKDTTCITESD